MKNKGFTLIELLAVIVILAIIALIATPVVLNIIKDSKNSSIERSAELYLSQVIDEIARYNMNHPGANFNPSECIVQRDDTLICDGTSLNIEINGDKPSAGSKILLSNGSITGLEDFKIGSKNLTYENGKIKEGEDDTSKSICTAVTTATTGNVPTGSFNYGDEYTCELGDNDEKTFFVLETKGDNVSLIMDKNIDSKGKGTTRGYTMTWCKSGSDNSCAADGALEYLKTSTTGWTKLTESQISLPSEDQLNKAAGNQTPNLQTWLYGNLNDSAPYGYWTSTPDASDSNYALFMYSDGFVSPYRVDDGNDRGVRPVITISKSYIN